MANKNNLIKKAARKLYRANMKTLGRPDYISIFHKLRVKYKTPESKQTVMRWKKAADRDHTSWDEGLVLPKKSNNPLRRRSQVITDLYSWKEWEELQAREYFEKLFQWTAKNKKHIDLDEYALKAGYPAKILPDLAEKYDDCKEVLEMALNQAKINAHKLGISTKGVNAKYLQFYMINKHKDMISARSAADAAQKDNENDKPFVIMRMPDNNRTQGA